MGSRNDNIKLSRELTCGRLGLGVFWFFTVRRLLFGWRFGSCGLRCWGWGIFAFLVLHHSTTAVEGNYFSLLMFMTCREWLQISLGHPNFSWGSSRDRGKHIPSWRNECKIGGDRRVGERPRAARLTALKRKEMVSRFGTVKWISSRIKLVEVEDVS